MGRPLRKAYPRPVPKSVWEWECQSQVLLSRQCVHGKFFIGWYHGNWDNQWKLNFHCCSVARGPDKHSIIRIKHAWSIRSPWDMRCYIMLALNKRGTHKINRWCATLFFFFSFFYLNCILVLFSCAVMAVGIVRKCFFIWTVDIYAENCELLWGK